MELWVGKYLVEHWTGLPSHSTYAGGLLNENDSNRRNNRQDDQLMQ
jgi:hypothetical protein